MKFILIRIALFVFIMFIYLKTLNPTVTFIDSGELSAAASTLGIAHPTGYPLFTLLGYIFTILPISQSEVYNLNVMSAFFCSIGIVLFASLLFFMLRKSETQTKIKTKKSDKAELKTKRIASPVLFGLIVFSSITLAFSNIYWSLANSVEVYSIHAFFLCTLIYFFLKAIFKVSGNSSGNFFNQNKEYMIFAFLLGLSFTNHMTTVLLAPACITLFIFRNYKSKEIWKLLLYMIICFIIGFSIYIYLLVRANMDTTFIWGNPYNLERFIWHITGKQFSVWQFSAKGSVSTFIVLLLITVILSVYGLIKQNKISSSYHIIVFAIIAVLSYFILSSANEISSRQINNFLGTLWEQFGYGLILLALPGLYRLSTFSSDIYYFTLLTFYSCIFYAVNYDIYDINSYFLLTFINIAIWICFGVLMISEKISASLNTSGKQIAFGILLVLISSDALISNYSRNDESNNRLVEEYTFNVFKNAEPNSIILSSQWDFWVSASWYYNFVKKIRPDIVVIDKELLRRSWYFKYLQKHYPEIYNNSKNEIEKFLVELDKFEHGIPYDTNLIMKLFSDMITSFVKNNPQRKFYTTWEIEQKIQQEPFAMNYTRIPDGLLFLLVEKDSLTRSGNILNDYNIYDINFTPSANKNYYHETLMNTYSMMLTNSALYLNSINRNQDALKYIELALLANPGFPKAIELKRKLLK